MFSNHANLRPRDHYEKAGNFRLEDWLRNGSVRAQSFIERWVNRLLYYDLPAWMFTLSYVVFALMVLLTWRRIPPRQRR